MAATELYLGASTPFGVIIAVGDAVYNAEATVRAADGGVRTYRLPFLLAHGVVLVGEQGPAASGGTDPAGRVPDR